MKKIIITIALVSFLTPVFTGAVREIETSGSFTAEATPANPAPGDRVVIDLKSYSFNLDGSSVDWYLDDKIQKEYNNKKQFVFFAGKVGTVTKVKIVIVSQKKQLTKTLVFEPAEVDLIWQAGTQTPAFYRGKALPSTESLVKILAIPYMVDSNSKKTSSEKLSFRWYINGNYVSNSSGIGKNTFTTSASKTAAEKTIGVLVSDPNSNLVAENKVVIKPKLPQVLLYEIEPLGGINYGQTLGNSINLNGDEITIKVEPYFFALGRIDSSSYSWLLNGQKITPPDDVSQVTFRSKEETEGVSKIKLTISSAKNSSQSASNAFTILFNNRVVDFNNAKN